MTARRLPEYLAASAALWPNRPAVIDTAGVASTFRDIERQSSALAGYLRDCGITRGDRVAILLPKTTAALVAMFGIMKAGAAYVPVDVTAPADRSRRILADCQVRAVISSAAARDVVSIAVEGSAPQVIVVGEEAWRQALDHQPAAALDTDIDDLAYIIYTSGSTGMPKGAMITHRNASSFVDWCSAVLQPTPEDRFSSHTPFHFDASVQDIYPAIKHGAALCLISEDLAKRPRELAAFIADRRLTLWTSTPSALTLLVQFGNLEAYDASQIRIVAFGGEVFPIKHLRALKKLWPSPTYYNVYGPTETTTTCVFAKIPCSIPEDRETPYPIGFPCEHCRALVLNDGGDPVGAGQEGVLHISGPSVFAGYWNRPAETAAAFLLRDGVKWYITGDVVRWDPAEGFTFIGRKDGMIKRRGFRIELGEIERALYLHPQIREVGAIALNDNDAGTRIVAAIACHGERPTIVDLKSFCASKIPPYMTPDHFIFRDALPKTSTGKIDYQTLRRDVLT